MQRLTVLIVVLLSIQCATLQRERVAPLNSFQIQNYLTSHTLSPQKFQNRLLVGEVELYESRQSLISLSGQFAMTSDRRFRLEVVDPFGQVALLAISDGSTFWILYPEKKSCERGSIDSGKISLSSLRVNIPTTAVLALVSGYPYHISHPSRDDWKWTFPNEKTAEILWTWGQTSYAFEDAKASLPQSFYYLEGGQGFKQEVQSWDEEDGIQYPDKWRLKTTWQQDNNSIVWKWTRTSVKNAQDMPQLFQPPKASYCPP